MPAQKRKKVYRTMQGKTIDIDMLRQRNELTPAVGNARVNARGDELGPGGKIVRKKEDLMKDYYSSKGGAPDETPVSRKKGLEKDLTDDWVEPEVKKTRSTKKPDPAVVETNDDWIEDADGNFVPKGE